MSLMLAGREEKRGCGQRAVWATCGVGKII